MVTTIEMWEEFMSRPSIECLTLFENEYKKNGDLPDLRNHNMVLMDIGEWQQARTNCVKIIEESDYTNDGDLIDIGMIDWFMDNKESAIDFWMKACTSKYTDLVGPIDGPMILWYAGQRLNDDKLVKQSLRKLNKFWKITDYRKIVKWPGTQAIAGFLMGNVPAEDLLCKWKWTGGALEYQRLCRVYFWIGMTLLKNSEPNAIERFQKAFSVHKNGIVHYEYFLAKWEYSRLTGENVWE